MSTIDQLLSKSSLSIFCSPNAISYTNHIVEWILSCFSNATTITKTLLPAPDICIIHITERIQLPHTSFTIVLSGESWEVQSPVDVIISPCNQQPFATISLYYPFLYSSLYERRILSMDCKPKKFFCAFMYYCSYPHRDHYFHLLSSYKKVTALGKACSTKENACTRFINTKEQTYNDIAVRFYSSFQFVLAIENTWKEGYFTEKLINPIIAHSIPIYWGHPSVFQYINKKRVIYTPDYTDESLLQYIDSITDEQYKEIINQPCYTEIGTPEKVTETIQQQLQNLFQNK